MQTLYSFFKSVKLAVVLILVIAVLSILATLIPQGRDTAFYYHTYSPLLANLIVGLGLGRFFSSVLFLIPAVLFFLNLTVCAVDRFVRRARSGARSRFGPDLVHIGLLLLIVGALLSLQGRQEGMVYLGQGDQVELPGGHVMRLKSFVYDQYPDGRPKEWISTVEITRNGEVVIPSFPIEVNHPLNVAGLKVYQANFSQEDQATVQEAGGRSYQIQPGQGFEWEGALIMYRGNQRGPSGPVAVFERWEDRTRTEVYQVAPSEVLFGYTVETLSTRQLTGLKAVRDPGFIPVVVALSILAAGLVLWLFQKQADLQRREAEEAENRIEQGEKQ